MLRVPINTYNSQLNLTNWKMIRNPLIVKHRIINDAQVLVIFFRTEKSDKFVMVIFIRQSQLWHIRLDSELGISSSVARISDEFAAWNWRYM